MTLSLAINYNQMASDNILINSIILGDYNNVELMIKSGINVNVMNGLPLIKAFKKNHTKIFILLLNSGANISANNYILIEKIIERNKLDIMVILIENNILTNEQITNIVTKTITRYTIKANMFQLLIDHNKININKIEDNLKQSKFIHENLELIKLFLENNIDIHTNDEQLIYYAVVLNNFNLVEFIFNNGINPNSKNNNLLKTAIIFERIEILKLLLDNKFYFNANKLLKTGLEYQLQPLCKKPIIELLAKYKINYYLGDYDYY